jgi:type II secretory pathway pseudopilin PulG
MEEYLQAANVIALLGIMATLAFNGFRQAQATRVERQENYLRLELASIEIFRFEAQYAAELEGYIQPADPGGPRSATLDRIADNFYLQQLNLFEIAARMRQEGNLNKHVFGSWVKWFYDAHNSWWFRERWQTDYRANYTTELRQVFDKAVGDYDFSLDDVSRTRSFFVGVARVFNCPIILRWIT